MTQPGPIESQTRRDIATLGDLTGNQGSLAELAYHLARYLDSGGAGLATAATARQLQATLEAIWRAGDDSAAGADLQARLSAPVVNPEDFGPRLVGLKSRRGGRVAGDAADAVAAPRRGRGDGGRPGDG